MKRFFLKFLAIFFPWFILFLYDNPGGALLAIVLQATFIGWIPASIWALRVVKENEQSEQEEQDDAANKNQQAGQDIRRK